MKSLSHTDNKEGGKIKWSFLVIGTTAWIVALIVVMVLMGLIRYYGIKYNW